MLELVDNSHKDVRKFDIISLNKAWDDFMKMSDNCKGVKQ